MSPLVPDFLRISAERFPERIAVVDGSRRVTYAELSREVDTLAKQFDANRGIAGERILILLENSPEFIVSYFAVMQAGGIAVPLSAQATGGALDGIIEDCSPAAVIDREKGVRSAGKGLGIRVTEREREKRGPSHCSGPGNVKENDVALILYTSGSAGKPKGVMLTHRNLVANAKSIVGYLKLDHEDSVMVILPFHYSYGNSLLTTHVLVGGCLVLENSFVFPNVVLDRIREERITGFAGVPSTFASLLNRSNIRRQTFPSLRYVTQAGGAMAPKLARDLKEVLPGSDIFIMYGQTEAAPRLTYLDPSELVRKEGSIGKAIPGVRITLRREDGSIVNPGDVGEIVAEGENIMAGYWNSPEETAMVLRNGGLYTGDLAREDEEGFIYIVGRRSEMIKTGGHRVSPKEIENILSEMAGVAEVAVIGVPDEVLGQSIKAFIVPKPGISLTEMDVLRYCSQKFEAFMIPKFIIFMEGLPKTTNDKINKSALRHDSV